MSTAGRAPRALAADLPRQAAPSPSEILAAVGVQPRTQNILRRYLAEAPPRDGDGDGDWTYGRLLAIPGFGQRALDDVVAALSTRRSPAPPAPRRRHRFLDDEIAELLSTRQRRRGWTPTPLLDRALTLIA